MTDKKPNEGTYVVLRVVADQTFETVDTVTAVSAADAAKRAATESGSFVVVPSRSWKLFTVEPLTVMQVKAVE